MRGSSYKEEQLAAKPDFKGGGTESGGKHILTSLRGAVDAFCLG